MPVNRQSITVELVQGLIAEQFPRWAHLAVRPVELNGWDNVTFRLGEGLSVRLPSHERYVAEIDKEHQWLPVFGASVAPARSRAVVADRPLFIWTRVARSGPVAP